MLHKLTTFAVTGLCVVALATAVFAHDEHGPGQKAAKRCHTDGCDPGNTLDGKCQGGACLVQDEWQPFF